MWMLLLTNPRGGGIPEKQLGNYVSFFMVVLTFREDRVISYINRSWAGSE